MLPKGQSWLLCSTNTSNPKAIRNAFPSASHGSRSLNDNLDVGAICVSHDRFRKEAK